MATPRSRLIATTPGSRPEAFGPSEWGLAIVTGVIWGSSFLFIAEGIEAFRPGVVALARLGLGTAALALLRRARRPIPRHEFPRLAAVGILWMSIPMVLIPYAQQWVDSAIAGMIIGAMPLAAALVTALLLRRIPSPRVVAGVVVGFGGIVAIAVPSASGEGSSVLGIVFLVVTVLLYGVAVNLAVPLQQEYGSLAVVLRAQIVAVIALAPLGVAQLGDSSWSWSSAAAMLPLGVLGSGVAFLTFTTLVGRAGADRGSVAVYLLPVVALGLGVTVRGEHVEALAVAGALLVIAGAWLAGRATERMPTPPAFVAPPGR